MSDNLISSELKQRLGRLREAMGLRSSALRALAVGSLPPESELGRINRALVRAAAQQEERAARNRAICKPPSYAGDSIMLYDHFYTQALDSALRQHGVTPKMARQMANRTALSKLEDCVADHAYKLAEKRPLLLHVFRTERGRELAVAWAEVQEMGSDASEEAQEIVGKAPEFNSRYAKAAATAWYCAIMQAASGQRGRA